MSRDGSVGIATRYGLDGLGTESRWGRYFPHPSVPALGPNQPTIHGVTASFPGGTEAWAWRWPLTPSSTDVKERVELYVYSLSGPSWRVIGRVLPLLLYIISIILCSPYAQLRADSPYGSPEKRQFMNKPVKSYGTRKTFAYPLSYGVPVRERYGSTLLPATREQHDQNCTQSH